MKIEFLHHYRARHRLAPGEWLVAYLPRYAHLAAAVASLANLRDRVPALARASERLLGFSARRRLPAWRRDAFRNNECATTAGGPDRDAREVVLFVDTFDRWFEPQNARAARRVLERAGYAVRVAVAPDGHRPLCCGRTFLASGLVDEARVEMRRMLEALLPYAHAGVPVVGLEPSCTLTLRDELPALLPGEGADTLASGTLLFEQFLAREHAAGRLSLPLHDAGGRTLLVHGHCHQKAFDAMGAVQTVLGLVPGLETQLVESSCCGMAGAFGYATEHYDVSVKMAELDLLPAIRAAAPDTWLAADGTSCRHQIADLAGREAVHVARVLERQLA